MSLFSQAGSLNYASHTVQPENGLARKTTATSGRKCLGLFERYNRNGLWAKTLLDCLLGTTDWYSTRCALTWKARATKYNRLLFQLVQKTRHTSGTGSGLLPTPQARDYRTGEAHRWTNPERSRNLNDWAANILLPTPTRSDHNARGNQPGWEGSDLVSAIHKLTNQTGKTSLLNPPFVEEMMGFPIGWTELPPSETQ